MAFVSTKSRRAFVSATVAKMREGWRGGRRKRKVERREKCHLGVWGAPLGVEAEAETTRMI